MQGEQQNIALNNYICDKEKTKNASLLSLAEDEITL